jgi:hypothetical protein
MYWFDPNGNDNDAWVGAAEAVDVYRVTNEDVRRGEITIERSSSDAGNEPLTLEEARYLEAFREARERERDYEELEYEEAARLVERRAKERRTLKGRAKKIWGKVRRFFGKRSRE